MSNLVCRLTVIEQFLSPRETVRVWGCWHISSIVVNNYDMTVKPYYQLLGISVRSCKHSCLAFLWNTALGRQEKERMCFPFRRNHWMLAQSHSNQGFLGGPPYLWLFYGAITLSPALQQLGCFLDPCKRCFGKWLIAANQERMLAQTEISKWKGGGSRRGEGWERAVQCYSNRHSLVWPDCPNAFHPVRQNLPYVLTEANPTLGPHITPCLTSQSTFTLHGLVLPRWK